MNEVALIILILSQVGSYLTWQNITSLIAVVSAVIVILKAHSLWSSDRPMLKDHDKRINKYEEEFRILQVKSDDMGKALDKYIIENNVHLNRLYELQRDSSKEIKEMMEKFYQTLLNKKINFKGEENENRNHRSG